MAPPLCIHLRTDQPANHPLRRHRHCRRRRRRLTPRIEPPFAPLMRPARATLHPWFSKCRRRVKAPRVGAKVFLPFIYLIELRNAISHERNPKPIHRPLVSLIQSRSHSLCPFSFSLDSLLHPLLLNSSSDNASEIPPRIERHFVRIHGDAAHCTVILLQRTRPLVRS